MKKRNDIDKALAEKFQMEPPADSWSRLNAELDYKQGLAYRKRGNRFKMLSIVLALLLISGVIYYYVSIPYRYNLTAAVDNSNTRSAGNEGKEIKDKPLKSPQAVVRNTSDGVGLVVKRELRARGPEHTTDVPATLSVRKGTKETSVEAVRTGSIEKENSIVINKKLKQDNDKTADALITTPSFSNDALVSNNSNEIVADVAGITARTVNQIGNDPVEPEYVLAKGNSNDSIATTDRNNTSRWSVTTLYSSNYTRTYVRDNTAANTADMAGYKNENSEYSYSTGLLVGYDLNEHMSLSTGCLYSTMAYSKSFSVIYVKYGMDDQLHYIYPMATGNIETPNSNNRILHEGDSVNVNAYCAQSFQLINVPLLFKYRVEKSRFTYYANGGLYLNYVLQEKAKLLIGTKEPTIINNIDGLKKINYGFIIGAGVQYNFFTRLGIFIEPAFRGSITSITRDIEVKSYPYTFALNGGLMFHF
jgi:hypothetical protein